VSRDSSCVTVDMLCHSVKSLVDISSYQLTVYIVYCTCCRASRVQQEC